MTASLLEQLADLPKAEVDALIRAMAPDAAAAFEYDWRYRARPEQLPPEGSWRVWLLMAGRGFGKTRCGAEWVRAEVKAGRRRIALVAPTAADARVVMVEGELGILAISPDHERPLYEPSKRRLTWIDYRFAAGDPTRLKTYAAELVGLSPDVILASTPPAIAAVRAQTPTIPIVFVLVTDAVGQGLVQSLARPGGNITGFSALDATLMGKWLQLLKEIAPAVTRVAVIFGPDTTSAALVNMVDRALEAAAASLGVTVTLVPVRDDAAIEETITAAAREPGGGLISLPNSFTTSHREVIVGAAARHGLPLMGTTEFPRAGGLMSYWFDSVDGSSCP